MIRTLFYILVLLAAGVGFAWFANFQDDIVIIVYEQRIVISIFYALCALLLTIITLSIIWWVIKSVFMAPFVFNHHLKNRQRDRGYKALSQGLIAVMSGDIVNARKMLTQSSRLIDQKKEPLILLLNAQTKQLEHDSKGAIDVFTQMHNTPNMRLLGLKGLYHEALKSKAIDVAHQYAAEASKLNPSLKWANRATVEQLSIEGDWEQAISLFSTYEKTAKKNKTVAKDSQDLQHIRMIMIARQAQEGFENYPDEAKRNALKAVKLEPTFIPAVTIAANILFKLDEVHKASKMIEKLWAKSPHPDLALSYVNAYQGTSALERLKRAQNLARCNPKDHASLMIVARTALEAGEYDLARQNALQIIQTAPTKNTYLLLSDIEAEQTGNEGKKREWLQLALNAAPDPVWMVDGMIVPQWVAISPISGHIGTCIWMAPEKNTSQNMLDFNQNNKLLDLEVITKPEETTQEQTIENTADKDFFATEPSANDPAKSTNTAVEAKTQKQKKTINNNETELPVTIILDAEPIDEPLNKDNRQPSFNRLNVDDPGIDTNNNSEENASLKYI